MTEISFIIVNYNSLVFIKDLLDSFEIINSELFCGTAENKNEDYELKNCDILKSEGGVTNSASLAANHFNENTDDFFYEIIIFDNGSSDGSTQYIEKKASIRKNIKLIKSAHNEGFCRGSNIAAKSASGKYLIFLNPDTKILEGNIKVLIDFLKEKEAQGEKVGITGVKTINSDKTLQYSSRAFPSISRQFFESFFLFKVFAKSRIFGSYFMSWWDHENIMEVDWLSGSFMFVKKEIFDSINGFNEDYFMYSEDTDICLRLKREGFKNYYFPCYTIMHLDSAIASRNLLSRELGIWKSRRLYFKKNYSSLHALIVSALYFLGILNRLLIYLVLFIFSFKKSCKEKSKLYFNVLKSYF
ncbi:MAG: glycosyltransferase family 2 protein [Candidatus Humimicrobiaceae bacterium]